MVRVAEQQRAAPAFVVNADFKHTANIKELVRKEHTICWP
jgi:hypothetical protein